MNRRDFFSLKKNSGAVLEEAAPDMEMQSAFYAPTTTPRPRSGLGKFTGTWTRETAAHLLRRTIFAPTLEQITVAKNLGMENQVTALLAPWTITPPLYHGNETNSADKLNTPWCFSDKWSNTERRRQNMKGWWVNQLVNQNVNLTTKMTLFWTNHLVTSMITVNDPRWSYEYVKLLSDNSFGNFKTMVRQVSSNAAMLRYLSGNSNTKGSPNENYARELMELFTLGVVDKNNNANYTEDDVVNAAKVLTGWQTKYTVNGIAPLYPWASFNPNQHDTSKKVFSSHFNNHTIQRTVSTEYINEIDDLMDMIFARQEVALFVVREMYRWFVYYEIDPWVEDNIITPLANQFRSGGYEIKPVIKTLLSSQHFYDMNVRGVMIKSPADFVAGIIRQFNIILNANNRDNVYQCYQLNSEMIRMGQDLLDAPNVAGWPEYYLAPNFQQLWLNAATIQARNKFCDRLLTADIPVEIQSSIKVPKINKQLFFITVSGGMAHDINKLIDSTVELFFPMGITANQRQRLKDVLIPGLPDEEWQAEWIQYLPNSTDNAKATTKTMEKKMKNYLYEVMSMAEFQLH